MRPALSYGRGIWAHDCEHCIFLGTHNNHDLYYCDIDKPYTLIARYGDDGPDYKSGSVFVGRIPEITEAHRRAIRRGLITAD